MAVGTRFAQSGRAELNSFSAEADASSPLTQALRPYHLGLTETAMAAARDGMTIGPIKDADAN